MARKVYVEVTARFDTEGKITFTGGKQQSKRGWQTVLTRLTCPRGP